MDDDRDASTKTTPDEARHRQYLRMRIGTAIQELRTHHGLSRTDLATRTGISLSHVSRIERGLTMPSYTMVEAIARELQADLSQFTQVTDRSSQADGIIEQVLSHIGVSPEDQDHILRTSLNTRELLAGLFANPGSIPDVSGETNT
jgi:transcriptional regulator with XRE-family HTH domain